MKIVLDELSNPEVPSCVLLAYGSPTDRLRIAYTSPILQIVKFRALSCIHFDMIPIHHLPDLGVDRPRLRLDAHCVSAHPLRMGARRHCCVDHSQ